MNAITPLSMVGLDPINQWLSPAVLSAFDFVPTTAVQMRPYGQVWVVGSSPTMESCGV